MIIDNGELRFGAPACIDLSAHTFACGNERISVLRREVVPADWLEDRRRTLGSYLADEDPAARVAVTHFVRSTGDAIPGAAMVEVILGDGLVFTDLLAMFHLPAGLGVAELSFVMRTSAEHARPHFERFLDSVTAQHGEPIRSPQLRRGKRAGGHLYFTVPDSFAPVSRVFEFRSADRRALYQATWGPPRSMSETLDRLIPGLTFDPRLELTPEQSVAWRDGVECARREFTTIGTVRGSATDGAQPAARALVVHAIRVSSPGRTPTYLTAVTEMERAAELTATLREVVATMEWSSDE